jgi:DNA end-binding protein Ku
MNRDVGLARRARPPTIGVETMARALWRGTISFGLVTIPVSLLAAQQPRELAFHMLDERDMSPIHNKRVNESTGKEVEWEHVVKGFEKAPGDYVVITDDDLRSANVEATQTIDVLAAVCADEIHPQLFDAPYYLEPDKAGRKAYMLLREALKAAKRVALAKIVIRTRQHLAAIVPDGDLLLLEVLRYPYELRDTAELDVPASDDKAVKGAGVTKAELELAAQLVATISKPFDPSAAEYRDTYHDDLLALIERKASGVKPTAAPAPAPEAKGGEVVDIVALLTRSLDEAKRKKA